MIDRMSSFPSVVNADACPDASPRTVRVRTPLLVALMIAGTVLMIFATLALGATLASASVRGTHVYHYRSVSLSDARVPPTVLAYVRPGHSRAFLSQCPDGFFVETSAYAWNGGALGAQHWNRSHDRVKWSRVTFDGVKVHNGERAPILFAAWCN